MIETMNQIHVIVQNYMFGEITLEEYQEYMTEYYEMFGGVN